MAILCARQNMALRGHTVQETSQNKGNVLEVLDLLAAHSEFKNRLSNSPRNCKYTSNHTQNDILLAACDTILDQVATEVKRAGVFAVMAV